MHPSEIGRSYDEIAHRWRDDDDIQTNGLAQFQRALAFAGKRGHALDVGCGCSGRFIDLLQGAGFAVEGVDVSVRMIELARERHPAVPFYHEDVVEWPLPRPYDFIIAWDSIWHLRLRDLGPVMRKLCAGLAPGGVLIFTTGALDGPEEKSDANMGPPVHYSVLGIPGTLGLLAEEGCVCRHLEYDQFPESHLYVIAQKSAA